MNQPAILALEDGTVFEGISVGATGSRTGEVVFNTAMTGYQEIVTDPSYARQLVTLTYPHIGNTGFTAQDDEAEKPRASGLIDAKGKWSGGSATLVQMGDIVDGLLELSRLDAGTVPLQPPSRATKTLATIWRYFSFLKKAGTDARSR